MNTIHFPMKKPEKIRVLIVDDHYIVRMGLISVVDTEPDMEVVAETDDGEQALQLFAKHLPDLVLLDLRMPGKSGIHTAAEIRAKFPDARILMLSAFGGSEDIHRAIQAGVQGYVLKSSSGENLVPALRAVAAGQRWIPKEIVSLLALRISSEELTTREVEVLNQLARGLANKEIADILNITEYTAKDHLKHILSKLRVADRTEAVTTAIQRGIIHL
jgi:DNA-binding NarL/FixJ family response regulator